MEKSNRVPGELPGGLVLVKFFSETCMPCKILSPLFDELEVPENVKKLSIDAINMIDWSIEYGIRSVPTTILFKDNVELDRVTGVDIEGIKNMLDLNKG